MPKQTWRTRPKLYHVYIAGRWGPEKHVGFVVAANSDCIRGTAYIVWDIVKTIKIPSNFWKNPLGLVSNQDFKRWKRRHIR